MRTFPHLSLLVEMLNVPRRRHDPPDMKHRQIAAIGVPNRIVAVTRVTQILTHRRRMLNRTIRIITRNRRSANMIAPTTNERAILGRQRSIVGQVPPRSIPPVVVIEIRSDDGDPPRPRRHDRHVQVTAIRIRQRTTTTIINIERQRKERLVQNSIN